mgnify:CR=1 FL=1
MAKTDTGQYQNFAGKAWETRYDKMGDDAEAAFERNHSNWVRFGLCRPPFPVGKLPLTLRHTPDYIHYREKLYFVEVQGCSPRKGIKIKCDKLVTLETGWAPLLPTDFFFWDSTRHVHTLVSLQELGKLVKSDQVTMGTFKDPGGEKPYWQLKTNMFTWVQDGETQGVG